MKKFVIFGNPVKHSLSPKMQKAAFKAVGIDISYEPYLLEDASLLYDTFISKDLNGANITVPFKENAFQSADEVVGIANDIKAVNVFLRTDKVYGYNTDGDGFVRAISEFENIKKVLILGAGGTARAISVALVNKNIDVTILNRSERNIDFFENLGIKYFTHNNFTLDYYDLVVNTTSAGLNDELYPFKKQRLENIFLNARYAFDCIYGKETPFLSLAKKENLIVKDGLDMLLYQGVLAWEIFSGTRATEKVIKAMRDALN